MFEIRVDIPALDRLCAILERNEPTHIVSSITPEVLMPKQNVATEPVADAVAPAAEEPKKETPKKKAAQKAKETVSEASACETPAEPEPKPEEPKPETEPVKLIPTLQDVMMIAREACKDPDKRVKITGELFAKYAIAKLSDLKNDQLEAFAEDLKAMEV